MHFADRQSCGFPHRRTGLSRVSRSLWPQHSDRCNQPAKQIPCARGGTAAHARIAAGGLDPRPRLASVEPAGQVTVPRIRRLRFEPTSVRCAPRWTDALPRAMEPNRLARWITENRFRAVCTKLLCDAASCGPRARQNVSRAMRLRASRLVTFKLTGEIYDVSTQMAKQRVHCPRPRVVPVNAVGLVAGDLGSNVNGRVLDVSDPTSTGAGMKVEDQGSSPPLCCVLEAAQANQGRVRRHPNDSVWNSSIRCARVTPSRWNESPDPRQ